MRKVSFMEFSLDDFMRESNRIEGIQEFTASEVAATAVFCSKQIIALSDLIDLVKVYQADALPRFTEGLDVRVGSHYPMRGGPQVKAALLGLLEDLQRDRRSPYRAHVEYETLHPFTDGNGRSGRALWLWMMGGIEKAPLGFLHHFYYQALSAAHIAGMESLESVRSEALEEAAKVCESMKTKQMFRTNRILVEESGYNEALYQAAKAIRALRSPARVAEEKDVHSTELRKSKGNW